MKALTDALIQWYEENKRDLPWRKTNDPYAIWVSEIMLQQTRAEAVKPYFHRFLSELPDIRALSSVDDGKLNLLWQGLGYYSRARNMKKAAQICVSRFGGQLPESFAELQTLPGIGDYTAAAIASFAFGKPCPAVDGNVLRVIARREGIEEPIDDRKVRNRIFSLLEKEIPKEDPGVFNQALIELGATLCGPDRAARCGGCPFLPVCKAFETGRTEVLPVRAPKKEKRIEERTVLVLISGGSAALQKRPEKGLLAGLWELPALTGYKTAEETAAYLEGRGCVLDSIEPLPHARHVFTHIVWEMNAYRVRLTGEGDFSFYTRFEREKMALPSAFKAFLPFIF